MKHLGPIEDTNKYVYKEDSRGRAQLDLTVKKIRAVTSFIINSKT